MKIEFEKSPWFKPVLLTAFGVHGCMFIFDVMTGFAPFLRGDRSWNRWQSVHFFLNNAHSNVFRAMAESGVVPGEYVLQLPFFLLAGIAGIILFQIALTIASVMCVGSLASRLLPWRYAPQVCAIIYLILPQNLAYAHQFVSETLSTAFCVFFLYFSMAFWESRKLRPGILAGLCLGAAIFIRPSHALILPAFLAVTVLAQFVLKERLLKGAALICGLSVIPLTVWVLIFTSVTGHFGYTSGVANLNWNLRSRVFLVQNANHLPKAPEVARFHDYPELYSDPEGISLRRFLSLASEHPIAFFKGAMVDEAIIFGRGNTTKFFVDYLGIAGDRGLKDWRNQFEAGGIGGLAKWAGRNTDTIFVSVLELFASVLTAPLTFAALLMVVFTMLQPRRVAEVLEPRALVFILLAGCLFFSVVASSLMVDRAQGKLRHPAEAGIILVLGLLYLFARRAWFPRLNPRLVGG